MKIKNVLMDEKAIDRAISRLSHEIIEKNKGIDSVVLIGIITRGVPMAEIIQKNIYNFENVNLSLGKLDITLYRDDLTTISSDATFKGSEISFDINGKNIILVDDVLFTGRTVRAAIDALINIGRPKSIQLCVLIDRGHRELPFRPDYVGKNVPTALNEVISVNFLKTDAKQEVLICEL